MELIDCLCDAAWSHDKDDRTHYSARLLLYVEKVERECRLLAMLAAKTPQFFNPLVAMEAEGIRDRILSENADVMTRPGETSTNETDVRTT